MRHSFAYFLFFAGASGLAAETLATPAPETFIESIDVRVVNVDVYVTNSRGEAVPGLSREQFALFDDGKEVEITNFEAIDERASLKQVASLSLSPDLAPAAEIPKPKPLNLVVFVDNFNLRPQPRNRVLKQLDGFFEDFIQPQDRVMVMTHDLGLNVRAPLTSKLSSFGDVLRSLNKLATRGPLTDSLTRQTLERIQSYGCTTEANVEARSYAQQIYNDTINTLSALRRTMDSLSGLEGRKAVLYVSDGLPLRPGEDVFAYLAKTCGDSSGNPFDVDDVANELRSVTTAANTNGVTLYTLEGAGLRGFTSVSVESMNSFQTPTMDFVQNANMQDSLFNLASETGGQAVLNSNDLSPHLNHIARDLRTYYSLGYSARQTADGRIHNLRVEVKNPGLKARCRKTYRDSTLAERMLAKLDAALWHGDSENALDVRLAVKDPRPEGKNQFLVPVKVLVPLSKMTLLPNGESFSGKFSVLVSSRDGDGKLAPPRRFEIPLELTRAQVEQGADRNLSYDLDLVMKKGESVLAVGVRDEVGGGTAFLQQELTLDKAGKMLPPAKPEAPPIVTARGLAPVPAPKPE